MTAWLWTIPALPFAGFALLALAGGRMPRRPSAFVACATVGAAAGISFLFAFQFMTHDSHMVTQRLWTWMQVGEFAPGIAFRLDALSLVMTLVVTGVGFLIHLYAVEYMAGDASFSRFMAYLNLFVGMMLVLVLADNLLLLYLGWEGVGLSSYLLIGWYYSDPANGRAARKAFVVTRVGDTALALALFLLFWNFGTLDIQTLMERAAADLSTNAWLATLIALLILGGAVGKSAQVPLQTWLPDAMAGPTPVSALIHAATMVTAGVYLIARTHVLFELSPVARLIVAIVGATTLLLAAFSALAQTDFKRVLAYSTISQIGYMFLALGVGAWSAALFHFMTHAFFKALLFLAAGAVIHALHNENDITKMGGLRRELPVVFWTFLAGAGALAALPLVTAGFYSKDLILWQAWSLDTGSRWLWLIGFAAAFLTSIYAFRLVFLVFCGARQTHVSHKPGTLIKLPLVVLAVLSIIGGFVQLPHYMGHFTPFSDFMTTVLPAAEGHGTLASELLLLAATAGVVLLGIGVAYLFYLADRSRARQLAASALGRTLGRFWRAGWGFDWAYDKLFVIPYTWLAHINRADFFDRIYDAIAWISCTLHEMLAETQTGRVRWYAAGIAVGAIVVLGIVVLL